MSKLTVGSRPSTDTFAVPCSRNSSCPRWNGHFTRLVAPAPARVPAHDAMVTSHDLWRICGNWVSLSSVSQCHVTLYLHVFLGTQFGSPRLFHGPNLTVLHRIPEVSACEQSDCQPESGRARTRGSLKGVRTHRLPRSNSSYFLPLTTLEALL
jgi:hypothetical protein